MAHSAALDLARKSKPQEVDLSFEIFQCATKKGGEAKSSRRRAYVM